MIFHLHHHHQHCLLVLIKVWVYLPHLHSYLTHHHQGDFLNLFNHLHQDQIIRSIILIFLYNSPHVSTIKNYLEIYLDDTIYELPDPPKLELGYSLLNTLCVEADDILDQEFINIKQQEDEVLEKIKEEYDFDEFKDVFDEGTVPQQLDFFYGGENSSFNRTVEFLSLSNENREFIVFLAFDLGQNLMTNNSLSIHIENGDIFYQKFKAGENFYNFLIAQQNDQTTTVPKRFSYHHSFEHYVQNFLLLFSLDDVNKFDLYSNKNAKYLFYRFNDYIEMSGGKKQIIKHTLKIKNQIVLRKLRREANNFLWKK